MEHDGTGIEADLVVRTQLGRIPSLSFRPFSSNPIVYACQLGPIFYLTGGDVLHVVREGAAKDQILVGNQCLGSISLFDTQKTSLYIVKKRGGGKLSGRASRAKKIK